MAQNVTDRILMIEESFSIHHARYFCFRKYAHLLHWVWPRSKSFKSECGMFAGLTPLFQAIGLKKSVTVTSFTSEGRTAHWRMHVCKGLSEI